jgi:hypothetical protein
LIHWKNFFEFEEGNNLFELKEDDLYVWDILRFHIYLDYMWEHQMEQVAKKKVGQKILLSFARVVYLFLFLFRPSRPNLFLTNSRDKFPDGRYYDKNAYDFLKRLHNESHIIETFQVNPWHYVYSPSLIHPATIINAISGLFSKKQDYSGLVDKINTELGLSWDNNRINRFINDFKSEKRFYKLIFRLKNVKRIYVTQNGIQKALFSAAKDCHIETIEFQHGLIDTGHLAYNYPENITSKSPIYVPDVLLTFSAFWGKDINYPVKKIIPMGNSGYATTELRLKHPNPSCNTIGFISADVFGLKLRDLAIEYASMHTDDLILFKLHPNEFSRKREYIFTFRGHKNIKVITNDVNTEELITSCDAIVLIQSTIAYFALQAGLPLFIYKEMTYYRHSHIFNNPNVTLISGVEEIVIPEKIEGDASNIFFEGFNENAYYSLTNFI